MKHSSKETQPVVAVPFFGGKKYRPMLDAWVNQYELSSCPWPYVVISHEDTSYLPYWSKQVDIGVFSRLIRAGQPFDIKGAIVCAYALQADEFLMLDADAFLMRDPMPKLKHIYNASCAMPLDHGAMVYSRTSKLDGEYAHIDKRCAGVMWFGDPAKRKELVNAYAVAWLEMVDDIPWSPKLPHLLEQYAWSVAHHRMKGEELSIMMNWAPVYLGDNPLATVNHWYGPEKPDLTKLARIKA